jgi:hypothetical protein
MNYLFYFAIETGDCTKHLINSLLLHHNGRRDLYTALDVRCGCVLQVLLAESLKYELRLKFSREKTMQADDFWSCVHQNKKQK